VNYLSRDCERRSTRNIFVITSTHIPQKVDTIFNILGLLVPSSGLCWLNGCRTINDW
jgi:hypothetical protein